ncbi:MAG: DUF3298 domain-containing protein [Bacteroidales bacterium]|nr:DUF3298 domain-containing protein [Bacteroidales bacterium]
MRIKTYVLAAAAMTMLAVSCDRNGELMETELYHRADSTAFAFMTMDAELPSGSGKVASEVRSGLSEVIDRVLGYVTSYEDERFFPPFDGDADDTGALLDYYRDGAFGIIARKAQEDADERATYIIEDSDLTDEQKEQILADFPRWEYDFSMKKIDDNERYVVFQSMDYIYMGGAHGGITGEGCLTFSKKDGSRVTDFVDASRAAEMQPLLIAGLLRYYSENGYDTTWDELKESLFIEDGFIPLPSWPLYPSDQGLNFVYHQYEIASYAEGMPSFTVPYADIEPFLTPAARELLGL